MKRKRYKISFLQILLLIVSIGYLGAFCYEMVWIPCENQSQAEDLKDRFTEKTGTPVPEGESAGKEAGVQAVDLSALRAQYPDIRGWLTIPGTPIDYPVMQSGEENPEYYLRRNYQGDYDINGSLFLQWNCSAEDGLNRIIYGHNMNSGVMFGSLDRYRDPAFWESHRKVFFQTGKGLEEYEIVFILNTDIQEFPFTKADFPDEDSLQKYVKLAKSQELFETEENVANCHTVLTLVTCAYEWDGARNVVIAVR